MVHTADSSTDIIPTAATPAYTCSVLMKQRKRLAGMTGKNKPMKWRLPLIWLAAVLLRSGTLVDNCSLDDNIRPALSNC